MERLLYYIEASKGEHILNFFEGLINHRKHLDRDIVGEFNNKKYLITEDTTINDLRKDYYQE